MVKIRQGGAYRTRDGRKVSPVNISSELSLDYPVVGVLSDIWSNWTSEGLFFAYTTDGRDLVDEWEDEPMVPPAPPARAPVFVVTDVPVRLDLLAWVGPMLRRDAMTIASVTEPEAHGFEVRWTSGAADALYWSVRAHALAARDDLVEAFAKWARGEDLA